MTIQLAADQSTQIKTSSIVLGSQLQPVKLALAKADPNSKLTEANPLVEKGEQLVLGITRVFRKDQKLYVYMEVYDPGLGADQKPSIAATLSGKYTCQIDLVDRNGHKFAFERADIQIWPAHAAPSAVAGF